MDPIGVEETGGKKALPFPPFQYGIGLENVVFKKLGVPQALIGGHAREKQKKDSDDALMFHGAKLKVAGRFISPDFIFGEINLPATFNLAP